MFRKKWFRFIVEFLIMVVLIGLFLTFDCVFDNIRVGEIFTITVFGSLSMVGTLIFYLCFDQMVEWDSGVLGVLRKILLVLGALVVIAPGILSYLMGYATSDAIATTVSPWLQGFITCWTVGGELTFVLYALGLFDDHEIVFPFVPLMSEVAGYIVGVIFAYIGGAVGKFCYWLPLILAGMGLILIIACMIKGVIGVSETEGLESEPTYFGKSSYGGDTGATDKERDTRKSFKEGGPIKSAIFHHVIRDPIGCVYDLNNDKLSNFNFTIYMTVHDIKIEYTGTFIFDGSGSTVNDQEMSARAHYKWTIQKIGEKTRKAYDEVCEIYRGYDDFNLTATFKLVCFIQNGAHSQTVPLANTVLVIK